MNSGEQNSSDQIFLIDGAAPFFLPFQNEPDRLNWSKAPLNRLVKHGRVIKEYRDEILAGLRSYCQSVKAQGYNAITFDDLAHLTLFDFYPYMLSRTVDSYQRLFRKVFRIAAEEGLKIYVTTDLLFWNRYIAKETGFSDQRMRELFVEAADRLFDLFSRVDGIVVRIGETDGVDVESHFKSRMVITTAKQCNRWLREILPTFEAHGKQLIFRTWGLGAFSVGDLIWNESTERKIFAGLPTENLIVSRKFGTADFFRFLELSPRIVDSHLPHIVEFQARREYEGFGEFPHYAGRQYQQYRDQLRNNSRFRGISTWCQTGGWSHFKRLTFLNNSSPWNELNSDITVKLFTTERTADELLHRFLAERFPDYPTESLVELVQLFDQAVDSIWYFKEFALQQVWFRRLRFPPLLWIFWDTILINRGLRLFLHAFIKDPESIRIADKAFRDKLHRIRTIAEEIDFPREYWELGVDTMDLLISIRHFYLGRASDKRVMRLNITIERYREKHPAGFQVERDYSPFHLRWITGWILFSLLLRNQSSYRFLDRAVLIPVTGWLFPLVKRWQKHRIPELANRQAIGMELFFR